MRRTLLLIVGLLAASSALAATASAHDYHRSKRAVEAPRARHHHAAPHRYAVQRCWGHRGHRRCVAEGPVHRAHAAPRYRPSYVIVVSPNGFLRLAWR